VKIPKPGQRDEGENEPSQPAALAEIIVFPNGPEESHLSKWLKMGEDALTDRQTG